MNYTERQLKEIGESVAQKYFPNLVRSIALYGKRLNWRDWMLKEYDRLYKKRGRR